MAMPSATMKTALIGADTLVASAWRNGGGVTREIAAGLTRRTASQVRPANGVPDAFVWRVSVADVGRPGPFSRFDGVDRTLVLLSGAGMTLVGAGGVRHVLRSPLERADFAGELAIAAELHGGPTRDFNLMTRRDAARGSVEVWRSGASYALRADVVLLFCVLGAPSIAVGEAAPAVLSPFDTLRIDDPPGGELRCAIGGDGVLLAAGVTLLDDEA
ncbi:HutD/Ves family protein [Burkholderia sp. TSV86]|uniref:HutD/Ves family protein n=1 Tax=Burkholderia sp. TSV86 TaxID=1385594 RepID=UPI00075E9198|nr:HutD family protein [Burkholderia sp. TSV86]KVE34090.1 histidine utilization protein HutD [Burkholderia sp. TSV86]